MASFHFLHAADVHLDSPLRGLARYEGVPADEVRTATRTAFNRLVDTAIEHKVAFVVLAGDLFDAAPRDVGGRLAVAAGFGRLIQAGIEVFALHGNHDAESNLTRGLPAQAGVHWFPTKEPRTLLHAATGTALHGQGFATAAVLDNLAVHYPAARPGAFNIGVLHTALGGAQGHEPYAPCAIEELAARNYDYWALGHVHGHAVLHNDPPIVYAGALQGRSIREVGPKGAVLVEVVDNQVQATTHLPLDVVRWALVRADVTGTASEAAVEQRILDALRRAVATEADGRPLLVRLVLSGATSLHGALQHWPTSRRDELRELAAGVPAELWLEKIVVDTTPDDDAAVAPVASMGDLASLLAADPATLTDPMRSALDLFVGRQSATEPGGLVEAARAGDWGRIIARAELALLARLGGAG